MPPSKRRKLASPPEQTDGVWNWGAGCKWEKVDNHGKKDDCWTCKFCGLTRNWCSRQRCRRCGTRWNATKRELWRRAEARKAEWVWDWEMELKLGWAEAQAEKGYPWSRHHFFHSGECGGKKTLRRRRYQNLRRPKENFGPNSPELEQWKRDNPRPL